MVFIVFFFNGMATTEIYPYEQTLSLHDALPIFLGLSCSDQGLAPTKSPARATWRGFFIPSIAQCLAGHFRCAGFRRGAARARIAAAHRLQLSTDGSPRFHAHTPAPKAEPAHAQSEERR